MFLRVEGGVAAGMEGRVAGGPVRIERFAGVDGDAARCLGVDARWCRGTASKSHSTAGVWSTRNAWQLACITLKRPKTQQRKASHLTLLDPPCAPMLQS